MSLEADYKRKRREQSMDFRLYQAANVRASRARKAEAEAKAKLAKFIVFDALDGFRAGRSGKVKDTTASTEWQRGYEIGRRK